MHILHVYCKVKPDQVELFKKLTIENASASCKEPGCARFDVVQQGDDPTRFVLCEAYRDADSHAAHRETPHYKTWIEKAAVLLAEPRTRQVFSNVYPPDSGW